MPETVSLTVKASTVRSGDLLDAVQFPDRNLVSGRSISYSGSAVESRKTGSVNTVIETTAGKIIVRADADVDVRREQQTASELEVEKAEFVERLVATKRVGAYQALATARQKVAKLVSADDPTTSYVDHWDLEKFVLAQATAKIWMEIDHVQEHNSCTLAEAVQRRLNRFANDIFTRGFAGDPMRALSRSTGVTSNYLADVDREAMMQFVSDMRYASLTAQIIQEA